MLSIVTIIFAYVIKQFQAILNLVTNECSVDTVMQKMWYNERISKHKNSRSPRFNLCCRDDKVELPLLQNPPEYLPRLLFDHNSADGRNYQQNICTYNMMFAFTSTGIKLDKSINHSRGPPTIRI